MQVHVMHLTQADFDHVLYIISTNISLRTVYHKRLTTSDVKDKKKILLLLNLINVNINAGEKLLMKCGNTA